MTEPARNARRIGIAAGIYAIGILLSRLVGLVREAVIGRTLGDGAEADVYWAAFVLPDFLNYLLAGGVLSLVLIPLFNARFADEGEAGAWRSFSVIATFVGVLAVAGTGVLWWLAPHLTPIVAPGIEGAARVELTRLVRIILPAQVFHIVGGLLSATLQARDRHTIPAMAPVLYTLGIVGFGLWLGERLGAEAFAWGVLFGSIAGPFGLTLYGNVRMGMRFRPNLAIGHPDFRRYIVRALPVMLGFSVVVLDDLIIKRFASLVGEGAISHLQYARTLMKVPMGVFGLAAGMAAFPTLTRLLHAGERTEAWRTLVGATRMMLLLAITSQVGLSIAGTEIAEVIWGTRKFTPDELAAIGHYTALISLGLWGWAAQSLVARGFYAMGNTWTPTLVGSVVVAVAWPMYAGLAEARGAAGLAMASAIAISVYVGALYLWLRSRLGVPDSGRGVMDALARLAVAGAVGYGAGEALESILPDWPALVRGGVAGGVGCTVCLAVAGLVGMAEPRMLGRRLLGRLRR